jgi:nucleotide-binding universal stress UspA family protein
VEWLATQSWANGLTIALVSVAHNPEPKVGMQSVQKASETMMEWETERGLLDVALRYWSDFLRERLPNSTIHHGVADGDPREMIARAANTWPADCVVMGSSGRKGFAKLLLGSVSQNVAANAKCSVEIVRGVPSLHYHHVHALIEKHRLESPLNIEPSQQKFGSTVSSSPIFFLH